MPIGPGQSGVTFTQAGILASAPNASGVYALYNNTWIYFGESGDIQGRLLDHLRATGTCIQQQGPTGFTFELVAGEQARIARQNQLIAAYPTPCNQRMG